MGLTVIVNKRSVVHASSSGKAIASAPDACKTPSPGGPVPIPYPNIAQSSDTASGSTTVKMDSKPIMLKTSEFSMSSGDEAGTAGGGIASSKFKGKAKFSAYSFDVKVDGKNVPRLGDPMTMNGNAPNTLTPAEVQAMFGTGVTLDQGIKICEAFCEAQAEYEKGNISGPGSISAEFEKRLAQKGLPSNIMSEATFIFRPGGAAPSLLTPALYNQLRGRISRLNNSLLRGVPRNPGGVARGPVSRNAASRLGGAMRRLRASTGGPGVGRTRRPDISRRTRGGYNVSDNKFDSYKDRNNPSKGMKRDTWGKGQKGDYTKIDKDNKAREVNKDNCKC